MSLAGELLVNNDRGNKLSTRFKMLGSKQIICITFIQRRPNVFDAGPTLYKCYTNVLCLLGYDPTL